MVVSSINNATTGCAASSKIFALKSPYFKCRIVPERNTMIIKNYTLYMQSRGKIDTVRGVDEHNEFVSREWTDLKGNSCRNFWDIDAEHPRTMVNGKVSKA